MEISQEIISLFNKGANYSVEDIKSMISVDSVTLNTWIKLGVFSKDKTKIFRLKTQIGDDSLYVTGKNMIDFLVKVSDLN